MGRCLSLRSRPRSLRTCGCERPEDCTDRADDDAEGRRLARSRPPSWWRSQRSRAEQQQRSTKASTPQTRSRETRSKIKPLRVFLRHSGLSALLRECMSSTLSRPRRPSRAPIEPSEERECERRSNRVATPIGRVKTSIAGALRRAAVYREMNLE